MASLAVSTARAESTPKTKEVNITEPGLSSVTEGSVSESDDFNKAFEVEVTAGPSGVKRRKTSNIEAAKKQPPICQSAAKKSTRVEVDISTTDLEDFYDPDYDPDDPTYEPEAWNISIVQSDDDQDVEEQGIEDDVFDIVVPAVEEGEDVARDLDVELPTGPGIPRLTVVDEDTMREEKYVVTKGQLMTLLQMFPKQNCTRAACQKPLSMSMKTNGCTVICKWTCQDGHIEYRWSSSPVLPSGIYCSNFQAVTSIMLSGNNFRKMALFARFLGLSFPSQSSFFRIQNKCVVPVVSTYWDTIRLSAVNEHQATQVTVSGDGRMDSPGYCAKYCTYTVMNQSDKSILAMEVVDKRETGLKSGLMEAKGFAKAMESIRNEDVQLKEVVTDAHPQITSIMKKSYPEVRHSYDMWHGAKNLGKKISKIACSKGNEELKPWLKDITNHFFHSAETCNRSVLDMKTKWLSILNHMTNRHSWALGECDHGPLDAEDRGDKQWLKPSSHALKELDKQVTEKRLLRTFPYYVTCQTTSELESFNNHVLMYAPKRNAFSYTVYRCRCQLAAIDYMKHLHRQDLEDKDGKPRCRRVFSKAANNWSVVPMKEAKEYSYIPELLKLIAEELMKKETKLTSKVVLEMGHPKRISKTIAPQTPPPTAELQAKKVARIKGKK